MDNILKWRAKYANVFTVVYLFHYHFISFSKFNYHATEWHDVQCNVTKYYVQKVLTRALWVQYLIFKRFVFAYRHRNRVTCSTRLNYEEPFIYSIKPQSKERYRVHLSDLFVATKRFCIRLYLIYSLFLQCTDSRSVFD